MIYVLTWSEMNVYVLSVRNKRAIEDEYHFI